LRGNFSACKAEEEGGLTPADDENAAGRKMTRKDVYFLVGEQYKTDEFSSVLFSAKFVVK